MARCSDPKMIEGYQESIERNSMKLGDRGFVGEIAKTKAEDIEVVKMMGFGREPGTIMCPCCSVSCSVITKRVRAR